jgi:hypothetical protein
VGPGRSVNSGFGSVASKFIEEKPDWAWDVAGTWRIESPQLAKHLGRDATTPFKITIFVTNNPNHTNIGRQIWAEFNFAWALYGAMRICTLSTDSNNERPKTTLKDFERACPLSPGRWPGPSPQGFQKCSMRWRGGRWSAGLRKGLQSADHGENEFTFGMNETGQLTFEAVMILENEFYVFKGTKYCDTEPPKANDPTIRVKWEDFRPPAPAPNPFNRR